MLPVFAQTINLAPTSSSLMRLGVTSDAFASIASAIRAWHASPSIADGAHLNDDLHVVTLSKELLAALPIELCQTLSHTSRCLLMSKLMLTELERVR